MRIATLCFALLLLACPENGGTDGGTDPETKPDAGTPGNDSFVHHVLDSAATGEYPLSLAVQGERIGVAYFVKVSDADRELRYVELGQAPQTVATVQIVYGVALAYGTDGTPYIGYLGGEADESLYWLQSDAALARRSAQGSWTTEIIARRGNDATVTDPTAAAVSDRGFVVGVWPALAVASNGTVYFAWRDVHDAQFPKQDWERSDIEMAVGGPGGWTLSVPVAGGNSSFGYGGKNVIVVANNEPALSWSSMQEGADSTPKDVWFTRREGAAWQAPKKLQIVEDAANGPSLAYREGVGYAIAYENRKKGTLNYIESADGNTWSTPDPVRGSGTGGWDPSLAFTPEGDPAIAYYECAIAVGAETCPAHEDVLELKVRRYERWDRREVDAAGGRWIKLAYLSDGRAVVAYRSVDGASVKLAIQR